MHSVLQWNVTYLNCCRYSKLQPIAVAASETKKSLDVLSNPAAWTIPWSGHTDNPHKLGEEGEPVLKNTHTCNTTLQHYRTLYLPSPFPGPSARNPRCCCSQRAEQREFSLQRFSFFASPLPGLARFNSINPKPFLPYAVADTFYLLWGEIFIQLILKNEKKFEIFICDSKL